MNIPRLVSLIVATALLTGALQFAVPQPAGAASIIALETFDPPGILPASVANQGSAPGWATPWLGNPGQTVVLLPKDKGLAYAVPGGGLIAPTDQALQITGNGNAIAARRLAAPLADEIYIGYLFRFEDHLSNNDFAMFCLNTAPSCDDNDIPTIGLNAYMGAGNLDFMVRTTTGNAVYSTNLIVGNTYYLVGKLYKSSGNPADPYDRFALWVNPEHGAEATPDVTASGQSMITNAEFVALRTVNNDGDTYHVDGLTLSSSWNDVVPPGAPAAIGLAAVATGHTPGWPALLLAIVAIATVSLSFWLIRPELHEIERREWRPRDVPDAREDAGD